MCYNYSSVKFLKENKNKGFTIAELIVVVAIFVIISGIVLINQNRFSSNIAIQNLAYQIALAVRQAQVYGLSVRSGNTSSNFDSSFGVNFRSDSPNSFTFYSDNNLNKKYDDPPTDTLISTFNMDTGTIYDVCAVTSSTRHCFKSTGLNAITSADITYKRPNPAAIITDSQSGANTPDKSSIEITVQSILKDRTKTIIITQAGQIYVQ